MRASFHQQRNLVTIKITPHEDDRIVHGRASLQKTQATFDMPSDFQLSEAHPDLLGLAAMVVASPWILKRLELDFPVSPQFAEASSKFLKIEVPNASSVVPPRSPGDRPGLSFSAGVDSMACLELMPANTVPVFSHRAEPVTKSRSLYQDAAPLHAIDEMTKSGRTVHKVTSDLEYMRQPVGFSVDPAPAVPLILLADYFSLDAIAFGTIAEAAYRTGTDAFIDYAKRVVFTKWKAAFQGAGLDYFNLVAPVSEMGTMQIARQSEFGHLAQSCVRGAVGEPCGRCVKCFRKSLIEASFTGEWPDKDEVRAMMTAPQVYGYLSKVPIRLEIMLIEALSGYNGDDDLLLALQDRVSAKSIDTSFTHAWYEPGMKEMVPEKYYPEVVTSLERFLPKMTPEQEQAFEQFNIQPAIESAEEVGLLDWWQNKLDETTQPAS